jgi:hypothetical protein
MDSKLVADIAEARRIMSKLAKAWRDNDLMKFGQMEKAEALMDQIWRQVCEEEK